MTFSLALQEQYRAEYWQKTRQKVAWHSFLKQVSPTANFCSIAALLLLMTDSILYKLIIRGFLYEKRLIFNVILLHHITKH